MTTKSSNKKQLQQLRIKALASIPPEDRLLYQSFGTLEQRIQERIRKLQSQA